jgi:hypothetical protein
VLVNPDIKEWFDRLQGRAPGAGGSAPRGQILPDYGSAALQGIVKPGSGMFGFNAPAISGRYQPRPPEPNPGQRSPMGIAPAMPSSSGAGTRDLGGAAIAAGIGKLGQGVEGALGDLAAKRQAAAAAAAGRPNTPNQFLTPTPPARPAGLGSPPGETFPPIGAASALPIQAQAGGGAGETGTAIGPGGSLPTFAQGGATAVAGGPGFVNQFLTGIKAGEGTPYSGHSPTGAIGAYGLTGAFIKQWAPGAGLPTDRDSYKGNAELQDKLATYAATQMYNKYGSWPSVANAWLTGSPTATVSSPGNMSPAAYVAKVMSAANAAVPGAPPLTSPSAAAYAAAPPAMTGSSASQFAGPGAPTETLPTGVQHGTYNGQDYTYQTPVGSEPSSSAPPLAPAPPPRPSGNGQEVIPGQGNPHLPGFDPNSVPFINTPLPGERQGMNDMNGRQYAGAQEMLMPTPGQSNLPQEQLMPRGGESPEQFQYRQDRILGTPAHEGLFPPNPYQNAGAGQNPLAAALAQGGNQPGPPIDQSALLALALSQGASPDFGGFSGLFG